MLNGYAVVTVTMFLSGSFAHDAILTEGATTSVVPAPWCGAGLHRYNGSIQTFTCSDGVELHIDHICDGVEHCSNFWDENCLMDVDPSLSTVNVTNGPVFVYLPRSKCRVGVCYSDFINPVNLHIMCRQLGYATFSGSSSVPNTQLISTVQPSDLPCFGPERTVQECLQGMNILVRNDCQNLLSFTCIQSCDHSVTDFQGSVNSPGYPNFIFSNIECFWAFSAPPGYVYTITFYTINLVQSRNDNCRNAYLELYLGRSKIPGSSNFKYLKLCNSSMLHLNLTAIEGNIWIRYVSGQYTGSLKGPKGFFLRYSTIASDSNNSTTEVEVAAHDSKDVPPYVIVLIGIALGLTMAAIFVAVCYYLRRRAKRKAQDIMLLTARWMAEQGAQYRQRQHEKEEQKRLINEMLAERPFMCLKCGRMIDDIDKSCRHMKPMWEWAVDINGGTMPLRMLELLWKDHCDEEKAAENFSSTVYEDIGDGNNNTVNTSQSRSESRDPKNRTYVSLSHLLESPCPVVNENGSKIRSAKLEVEGKEEGIIPVKYLAASASKAIKRSPLASHWRWNSTVVTSNPNAKEQSSVTTTVSANNLMAPMMDFFDSASKKLRSISSWRSPSPGKTSTPTGPRNLPLFGAKSTPLGPSKATLVIPTTTPKSSSFSQLRTESQLKRFNTTPMIVIHPGSVKQVGSIDDMADGKELSPRRTTKRFRFPPSYSAGRSRSCPSVEEGDPKRSGLATACPTPRKSSADSDSLTPVFCESWSPISPPADSANFHFQDSQMTTPIEVQSCSPTQSPSLNDIV